MKKGKQMMNRRTTQDGKAPRSAVCAIGMAMAAALACLARGPSARAAGMLDFKQEWIPGIAVPRMTHQPNIDGIIDPAEWREAAAISGIANVGDNVLIPRPTVYYLAWDNGHLYLACRTYLRPGYKPAIYGGRADGLAYTFDDGMEFVWKPMGRNVVNRNAAYKFFVNCIGFKGDTCRLTLGQMFKDWNPKFRTAWRMTDPGTAPDGGRWWELEMSCTPEDFELKGDNRAGDEWRLMLGFNHIPGWMQARIPCLGSYFDDSGGGYPRAVLVEDTPAVKFLMEDLKNLATDGTASLRLSAFNPRKEDACIEISVDVAGVIQKGETLTVPAGSSAEWNLNQKLPADVSNGVASVKAVWAGRTLLSYTTFFRVGYEARMLAPVSPPDPNKFGWDVKFNPVKRLLMVSGDTWFFENPEDAKEMTWKVYQEGHPARAIAQGSSGKTVLWRFQDLVQLPELEEGKYVVEGVIAMKDGGKRGPMQATIEKKNEAREFASWWGKKFGNPDQIVPPFDPIRTGDAWQCWGRSYRLTSLGLPAAVVSQGRNVLAAPAKLVVRVAGEDHDVPLSEPIVVDAKDWRVSFKGQSRAAGLVFSAEGWMEQDGLVYVDLTYSPEQADPVTVENMRIEYPVVNEDADALVCIGPGGNFSSMTAMLIPPDRKGVLWSTLVTGKPGSRMARGNFYPTVWIGSERCGFLWWGDNDRGWFPEDDIPAHEVARAEAAAGGGPQPAVVLRNNIIGKPAVIAGPRTISFSYMATPFRPFTKGWRAVNATDDGTFFQPHRSVRKDSKTGKPVNAGGQQMNWIHPESRYPEEWDAMWAEQKTSDALGFAGADRCVRERRWYDPYAARSGVSWQHMSFTLFGWGPKSIEEHLYRYFSPGGDWDDEYDESFINYALYLFDGAFGKGGVVQTYFDITFPTLNENPVSGLCYLLDDGRIQPGYVGWNARRFYQRLQALMAEHRLVPNGHGGHSTQAYLLIAMPWMDAVLDGELNFNVDVSDRDWIDYYPIERMRSMSSPHNWGVPICWMGHLDSADKKKTEFAQIKRQEYLWMHDSWKNPYGGGGPRTVMPDTILDFGLNGDATAYHPYWRNPYATAADSDLLVSLWRIADRDDADMRMNPAPDKVDRVLVGVFNYNRTMTKAVSLRVDLKALGLTGEGVTVSARELYGPESGENAYFPARGGNANVEGVFGMECRFDPVSGALILPPLPPHRGRFVGISAHRTADEKRIFDTLKSASKGAGAAEPFEIPPAIVNWGAVSERTVFHDFGAAPGMRPRGENVRVASWVLPDRVLLALANGSDKPADAEIEVDLDALNLTPRLVWQEFMRVRDFGAPAAGVSLDFHNRVLSVKRLEPGSLRLVGLRRY